jgi:hypothetical protein
MAASASRCRATDPARTGARLWIARIMITGPDLGRDGARSHAGDAYTLRFLLRRRVGFFRESSTTCLWFPPRSASAVPIDGRADRRGRRRPVVSSRRRVAGMSGWHGSSSAASSIALGLASLGCPMDPDAPVTPDEREHRSPRRRRRRPRDTRTRRRADGAPAPDDLAPELLAFAAARLVHRDLLAAEFIKGLRARQREVMPPRFHTSPPSSRWCLWRALDRTGSAGLPSPPARSSRRSGWL